MLHAQNLDRSLWVEVVINVVYTQNHCSTSGLDFIMSKEVYNGRQPCIVHMSVFGCISYVMVLNGKTVGSMQMTQNIHFWFIVRELRPIDQCICKLNHHQK